MRARRWMLAAAAAVVVGALATVPFRDLFDPDETTYAEVAREMLATGQWLVPHLDGGTYAHKPPLYIWALAALRALGLSWTAAGVVPALAAFLAVIALLPRLARSLGLDEETGAFAAVVFASSPLVAGLALGARMDMGLTLCFAGSLLFLARLLRLAPGEAPRRRDHLGLWLCIALGVLTKGPAALAMPLLAAAIFAIFMSRGAPRTMKVIGGACAPAGDGTFRTVTARGRVSLRDVFVGWGPALAAALVLAWLVPAAVMMGKGFLREVVVRQSAGRIAHSFAHLQPFYYHLVTYPISGLPWSFAAVVATYHALSRRTGHATLLLASAVVGVIGLFTLVSGKLVIYLLPLFVPAALLVAEALRRRAPGVRAAVALGAALTALLPLSLAALPYLRREVPPIGAAGTAAAVVAAALALAALLLALRPARLGAASATLAVAGLAWPALLLPLLLPRIGPFLSVRPLAEQVRALEPAQTTGLTYGTAYSGLALYAERTFRRLDDPADLRDALAQGRAVVMYERELAPLRAGLAPLIAETHRMPFERGALVLVRGKPTRVAR